MNIVIIGNGKVGRALIENLSKKEHNIVVIDEDYTNIHKIINNYDVKTICGNGAVYDIQMKADIDKSDITIAVTPSDEVNLLSCIMAKYLGSKNTVARVSNIDYSAQLSFMKTHFNLNMIVNSEKLVAEEILNILKFPNWLNMVSLGDDEVKLVEITLKSGNKLINNSISYTTNKFKTNILVYALNRGKDVLIPTSDLILKENDKIHIIGTNISMQNFFINTGFLENNMKSVMIIGGSKVSVYLANQLTNLGIKVKIIEKDIKICRELTHLAPKSKIINEDGTIPEVLLEEGINNIDTFISMTGIDEKNIIISMYAYHYNVPKIITKINNTSITTLLEFSGLNTFIFPKNIIADKVVQYIQEKDDSILKEYILKNTSNKIKIIEFLASKKDKVIGIRLKNINIKPNMLVITIIRNDVMIVPTINDYIKIDDRVMVLTTNRTLRSLDNILY